MLRWMRRGLDLLRGGRARVKQQVFLGRTNDLHRRYPEHSSIGRWSYGDVIIHVWDEGRPLALLTVGAFCSFGERVQVFLGEGHHTNRVTTFPFNTWEAGLPYGGQPPTKGDVVIGNDVWVATEAMIMSGVTIGDGAIVAARAVVTADVEPYSVVAGNPARLVRKRYDEDTIERLLAAKWWELPDDEVTELLPYLYGRDVEALLLEIERRRGS